MERDILIINTWDVGIVLDLVGWGKFCNFAVQFTKSCPKMNETIFDFTLLNPTVRNWGFLENWKSTASVLVP